MGPTLQLMLADEGITTFPSLQRNKHIGVTSLPLPSTNPGPTRSHKTRLQNLKHDIPCHNQCHYPIKVLYFIILLFQYFILFIKLFILLYPLFYYISFIFIFIFFTIFIFIFSLLDFSLLFLIIF